jgi:hypothetical protein
MEEIGGKREEILKRREIEVGIGKKVETAIEKLLEKIFS